MYQEFLSWYCWLYLSLVLFYMQIQPWQNFNNYYTTITRSTDCQNHRWYGIEHKLFIIFTCFRFNDCENIFLREFKASWKIMGERKWGYKECKWNEEQKTTNFPFTKYELQFMKFYIYTITKLLYKWRVKFLG